MGEAKSKAKRDTWGNRHKARQEWFDGYKYWQRMAIVMSIKARKAGLDFDWMFNASYERLTEELHKEMRS